MPPISGTLGDTCAHRHKTKPIFIQDRTQSFDLETSSRYKHTNTYIYLLETDECGLHAVCLCPQRDISYNVAHAVDASAGDKH